MSIKSLALAFLIAALLLLSACANEGAAQNRYITRTFVYSINDMLTEFSFELFATKNEDEELFLERLVISEVSTSEIHQTIQIPEKTMHGYTRIRNSETWDFELEDLNFDGYLDIRIFDTTDGNHQLAWIYLVYNPAENMFENDTRLNAIPLALFDQENQEIRGMFRSSAADHWFGTYRYLDGEIVLVATHTTNYVRFLDEDSRQKALSIIPSIEDYASWGFMYEENRKLNLETIEWEIINGTFMLIATTHDGYDVPVRKFDVNSDIGRQISGFVNWRFTVINSE